jgi:MFS family permease
LFFPDEDPLTATLAAFGTYFIGFVSRPIGAAMFGRYGDRIGRKGTLIATLLCMGVANIPDCRCSDLLLDRHLGCRHLDHHAYGSEDRRWRRMGRLSRSSDGMVTSPWTAWIGCILAAIRRPGWFVSREPVDISF